MNNDIDYYGITILLRRLHESGCLDEREVQNIAARISVENKVNIVIRL